MRSEQGILKSDFQTMLDEDRQALISRIQLESEVMDSKLDETKNTLFTLAHDVIEQENALDNIFCSVGISEGRLKKLMEEHSQNILIWSGK